MLQHGQAAQKQQAEGGWLWNCKRRVRTKLG